MLPCSISRSRRFSMPSAGKLRRSNEPSRDLFHALARAPRVSTGGRCPLVFPPRAAEHFTGRLGRRAWPWLAFLCCRLSAETGSAHGQRSLRLHAQSSLSWQRHDGPWGRHRHAVMDLRIPLFLHFAVFYFTVMRREEKELQVRHGAAFQEYARAVPLFLPCLRPSKWPAGSSGAFSFAQYKKNHEWHAALGFLLLLGVLVSIWYFRRAPTR